MSWDGANIGEAGEAGKSVFYTCLVMQTFLTARARQNPAILALLALVSITTGPAAAQVQSPRRASSGPTIELSQGLVITKSARVAPRVYRLPGSSSLDSAVITIRGDNITLDFAGATMEGAAPNANPDVASGIAIRIDGGSNIRILNARIRGYQVGIIARGTRTLSLIDNDLSYNWKPRLYSLIEHESLIDWLSFHHNEKDEWLRYGAGDRKSVV
jgi:hypothetical protein